MRVCVEGLARVHAVSQLLRRNQTDIGHNSLVRAKAAALLDQAGDEAVERAPGDRSAGTTIDAFDVGLARAQRRDIDTDTAAARHDLGHLMQRFDDAAARVTG